MRNDGGVIQLSLEASQWNLTFDLSPSSAVKATFMVYLMARPVMVPWARGTIWLMASTMLAGPPWLFRENSLRTCRQGHSSGFHGNGRDKPPCEPGQSSCWRSESTWLEYWTTPTLVALRPMSSVLRMSIMNFLIVSNSCGRTLRELSMRKTRSTGPDLHFCSGPAEGKRSRCWSWREPGSHNAPLSGHEAPGRVCGFQKHFSLRTQQLRYNFHIFTT